ncbi:MAG: DUF2974 domain-containing protein [Ruminococcus sp.]|nr:DUF2974 domain-containing protein [Ruminococcus sp.]
MNMMDYLDWRGDVTFEEKALNEVDSLILSTLSYLAMEGLVSEDDSLSPTIGELWRAYEASGCDQSAMIQDPGPLLKKAAGCARFERVVVSCFVNTVASEERVQFSAVTFRILPGLSYIAFRGTDNTIVGWREDCDFSFTRTTGQIMATQYVERIAEMTDDALIVGGHSKGGNFAVYAAAFCDPAVRDTRIRSVYSNDGPGMMRELVETQEYHAILERTIQIIPESSVFGVVLSSRLPRKIIKSDEKFIYQHNPYSWEVLGSAFVRADERTHSSIFLDDIFRRWIDSLSAESLRDVFNTIFNAIEASGAVTVNELNENKFMTYGAILKAVAKVEPKERSEVLGALKKLLLSGRDAITEKEN